jgi:hypothetical protein
MIKIKITESGGYVVGDGECPFDPDSFLLVFMNKIMEARRAGLNEIGVSDAEIDDIKKRTIDSFLGAPVTEIPEEQDAAKNRENIFAVLDQSA